MALPFMTKYLLRRAHLLVKTYREAANSGKRAPVAEKLCGHTFVELELLLLYLRNPDLGGVQLGAAKREAQQSVAEKVAVN